ncbi:histidine kinase [Paenibacillus nasutitermitis]|nr:sensor histidine kinase [Paenibacillus nasutitermitis]
MFFPAYVSSNSRLDIRIVPWLLGTLFGGWRTGFYLYVLIILIRFYHGLDLGFYTTIQILHLLVSVEAVLFFTVLNETIRGIIRKNQQLQSEAKDAEIAFLRSQIKPHFLFNTLNSIAVLCMIEPRKAEELTLDFAQHAEFEVDANPDFPIPPAGSAAFGGKRRKTGINVQFTRGNR